MFRDPSGLGSEMEQADFSEEIHYELRTQIVFIRVYKEANPMEPGIDKIISMTLWTRRASGNGHNNGMFTMSSYKNSYEISNEPYYDRNNYTTYDLDPIKYNNNTNDNVANSERTLDQIKDFTEKNELTMGTVIDFYDVKQEKIIKKIKNGKKVSKITNFKPHKNYTLEELSKSKKWIKFGQGAIFWVTTFVSAASAIDNYKKEDYNALAEDVIDIGIGSAAYLIGGPPGIAIGLSYSVLKPLVKDYLENPPTESYYIPGNQGTILMPTDNTKVKIKLRSW